MRRLILVLLALALPAAAAAQPLSISASVAVAWINPLGVPDYRGENPPSVGMVSHPILVVLWRGEPGWALTAPGGRVGFGGRFEGGPGGDELHSIVVEHGGLGRRELGVGERTGDGVGVEHAPPIIAEDARHTEEAGDCDGPDPRRVAPGAGVGSDAAGDGQGGEDGGQGRRHVAAPLAARRQPVSPPPRVWRGRAGGAVSERRTGRKRG